MEARKAAGIGPRSNMHVWQALYILASNGDSGANVTEKKINHWLTPGMTPAKKDAITSRFRDTS